MDFQEHPISSPETRLLISELQTQVGTLNAQLISLQGIVLQPSQGQGVPGNTPQAVNQIRNGTFSHSTNSWNNTPGANDGQRECAWYYSHPIQPGQPMMKENYASPYQTLVLGTVSGNTIQIIDHWLITGTAVRFTGSMPSPLVAGTTYYIIVIDDDEIQVATTLSDAFDGTPITLTDTTTGGFLVYTWTLKTDANTYYSETFADWDIPTGSARLTDDTTDLSCFFPGNNIEAGYSYFAAFSIVRTNPYVFASPECRIFAGIYGYSTAATEWNWLNAPYEIGAQVLGTVTTPTEREYFVKVETDRGISLGTSPLVVLDTPSDADFGTGARVFLQWPRPLSFGVTSYTLYRRTPTEFDPADVDTGTNRITITGSELTTGQPIQFTNSGGGLPAPLVAGTVYYAIRITADVFEVATTEANALAGTEIPLTTQGTGDHFLQVYLRLETLNGISYLDNGAFEDFATGYPTADFNELVAYTATVPNVVATLPYSGDPLFTGWVVLPFAIRIPQNYDKGDTDLDLGQWLRWGLTDPLSLRVMDGDMNNASTTLTSPSGQFTASLVGKNITVTSRTGVELKTTINTFVDVDELVLTDPWLGVDDATLTVVIEGGAPPHSLLIDLAHCTYIQGAGFSPNPEDISPLRGIPTAVPNGTTQGPTIPGQLPGTGDGAPVCLFENETVVTKDGEVLAKELQLGMLLPDGYDRFNKLIEIKAGVSDVWLVETENGATLLCTETKLIYTAKGETKSLKQLVKGDTILTVDNGVVPSKIITIERVLMKQIVVQIGLTPNHSFMAGMNKIKVLVDNNKPLPQLEIPPQV